MSGRVLYIDCASGVAGDMMLGALLHVGADEAAVRRELDRIDLDGWTLEVAVGEVQGISGLDVQVRVGGAKEVTPHHTFRPLGGDHAHPHPHPAPAAPEPPAGPGHGRTFGEIRALLVRSGLSERVRALALDAFGRLAVAEARVHGVAVDDVHFHEVGAVDAIVDIVGSCAALASLGDVRVVCAPLPMGRGFVRSAHGRIPLPAPATLEILAGAPVVGDPLDAELVTPTGAALVMAMASSFGRIPEMVVERTGYGLGDARWPDRPNALRLILGQASEADVSELVVEATIDDMAPELFGPLFGKLLEAGADDVWLTPVHMKKGRPGVLVSALVPASRRASVATVLFRETTTLGVRLHAVERMKLARRWETVRTSAGEVRMKLGLDGDTLCNAQPEYEDCARLAEESGVPTKQIHAMALAAFWSGRSQPKGTP
jgi:uncharacterized protein (TIGR00299 family) protein